jgi:hypothetical protein
MEPYAASYNVPMTELRDKFLKFSVDELSAMVCAMDEKFESSKLTDKNAMADRLCAMRLKVPRPFALQQLLRLAQAKKAPVAPRGNSPSPSRSRSRGSRGSRGRRGRRRSGSSSASRSRSRPRSSKKKKRTRPRKKKRSRPASQGSSASSSSSRSRSPSTQGMQDKKPPKSKFDLAVENFAARFSLKVSAVIKLARGEYTFIYETTPGQLTVGAAFANDSKGATVLQTVAEKKQVPADPREFMLGAEVLVLARELFRKDFRLPLPPAPTGAESPDRNYVNFIALFGFAALTPVGVALIDSTIRRHCAANGLDLWPIPAELAIKLMLFIVAHSRRDALTCRICGDLSHELSSCAVRDLFEVPSAPQAPAATDGKTAPSTKKAPPVCHRWMSRSGSCKRKNCKYTHECSFCQKKNTHARNCSRP